MKKNNKKIKLFSLIFLIPFCLYFQTVAYSAINSTMTIKGDAYKYEEGMTWRDWVDSSYDTRGFVNNNDLIYTDDLMYALVYEEDNGSYTSYSWPYIDDLIDPNLVYVTFYEAGEDGEW